MRFKASVVERVALWTITLFLACRAPGVADFFPYILGIVAGSNITVSGSAMPTVAVTNAPQFTGSVVAGSGTAQACTAGDGCFSRSTTTGAFELGGSSKSCVVDYNITATNYFTNSCGKTEVVQTGSANANWTVNNTGTGNTVITYQTAPTGNIGQSISENFNVTTSATPSAGPNTFASINFVDSAHSPGVATGSLWGGISDHGDGNYGGYFLINTTSFAPSPVAIEAIQVTPGGHVGFPQAVFQANVTSPTSCSALTTCGTYTWTFAYPFYDNAGNAQNPICLSPSIEDSTSSSAVWSGNVKSGTESSASVQFNYAPLLATVSAHNLVLTMTCYQGVY